MGRRAKRRRPTRAEKIKKDKPATGPADKKSDDGRRTTDDKPKRRRAVSAEALEIGRAYAQVMGWPLDRVLPHAECR